jgi:hypothetical protein
LLLLRSDEATLRIDPFDWWTHGIIATSSGRLQCSATTRTTNSNNKNREETTHRNCFVFSHNEKQRLFAPSNALSILYECRLGSPSEEEGTTKQETARTTHDAAKPSSSMVFFFTGHGWAQSCSATEIHKDNQYQYGAPESYPGIRVLY